jgi:hypothetical protein
MLSLLDEAIADLRAATGQSRFDLSLSTVTDPPLARVTLLPALTPKEAIEQVLLAARIADHSAERATLLRTALTGLDRDAALLPADWLDLTRAGTQAQLDADLRVDRMYQALTGQTMAAAASRARAADVQGLERLVDVVRDRDQLLGTRRPDVVNALVAAIELKLDAVRRLQLARDHWALREPVLRSYQVAIEVPLARLGALKPTLENIKSVAGNSAESLVMLSRSAAQILLEARRITPPSELRSAHAMLLSAVQLAGEAARIRHEATLAGDITRAWDASSAAAGALLIETKARTDIEALLRPPQLR